MILKRCIFRVNFISLNPELEKSVKAVPLDADYLSEGVCARACIKKEENGLGLGVVPKVQNETTMCHQIYLFNKCYIFAIWEDVFM